MTITRGTRYEEKSFWLRDDGPYEPNPPLAEDITVDVAIVGGGFTGLSTAREFKQDNPGASVAVVEGEIVGYGASGRNAGFNMKLFGLEPEVTKWRWGAERTIQAHRFMQQAVARVQHLIEEHDLQSDYRHTGLIRVAYSPPQLKRLEKTYALFQELGLDDDMTFATKEQLQDEFITERYAGGLVETESGILNPCKHVRELKRLAMEAGADIYENTPVSHVSRQGDRAIVHTRTGRITAQRLVLATNAFSRSIAGLPKLKNRQAPVWTFIVITEPLTDRQWADIGWLNRQSFEDNRQLIHYFRPTVDGRILMGGNDITVPFGAGFDHDFAPAIWRRCEEHLTWIFPQLADVRVAYRWGGPVSVNLDMTPEIGFIGDERVIYATGYLGHGVSLSQLNGRVIADLLGERRTELSDFWMVNRKAVPLPGGIVGFTATQAIRAGLAVWDRIEERSLNK